MISIARTKRIYILTIKVNKLFSYFFLAVLSKRNRKLVLRVSIELQKHSWKLGRTRKSWGNTRHVSFPQHSSRFSVWLDRNSLHAFYCLKGLGHDLAHAHWEPTTLRKSETPFFKVSAITVDWNSICLILSNRYAKLVWSFSNFKYTH